MFVLWYRDALIPSVKLSSPSTIVFILNNSFKIQYNGINRGLFIFISICWVGGKCVEKSTLTSKALLRNSSGSLLVTI